VRRASCGILESRSQSGKQIATKTADDKEQIEQRAVSLGRS